MPLSQAFRALADLELLSRSLPRHPGGRGAGVRDRTQELLETAAPGVCAALIPKLLTPTPGSAQPAGPEEAGDVQGGDGVRLLPSRPAPAPVGDARLSELEARWRQTGQVEDHAAWLRARLAAGTLAPDRVELAARLGDPAAALATDRPQAASPPADLLDHRLVSSGEGGQPGREELCQLQGLPHEERVLVLVVALEALLSWWRCAALAPASAPDLAAPARAVAVAREWVEEPSPGNALRALHAARESHTDGSGCAGLGYLHLCRAAADTAFACGPPQEPFDLPRGRRRRPLHRRESPEQVRAAWERRSVDAYVTLHRAFRALGIATSAQERGPDGALDHQARVVSRTRALLEATFPAVSAALIPRLLAPPSEA